MLVKQKGVIKILHNGLFSDEKLTNLKNATVQLPTKLEAGEQSARERNWLSADDVEARLGMRDDEG